MRMIDVLEDLDLDLELMSEGAAGWRDRQVLWCAPTEQLDPSPHLSPGALLLTTGMGLAFRDRRVWAAYVERLRDAKTAGIVFGLSGPHDHVPEGLLTECRAQRMPLMVLAASHPLLEVVQRVNDALSAERTDVLVEGWSLADDCTKVSVAGGGLEGMLRQIATAVDARVSVVDDGGVELSAAGAAARRTGKTSLSLPSSAGGTRFRLVIEGMAPGLVVQPILGPAAAILGMSLADTLDANSPMHSAEAARFIGALYDRRGTTRSRLEHLAQAAGFDRDGQWVGICLFPSSGMNRARLRALTWRIRTALDSRPRVARFMEHSFGCTVLVQSAETGWGTVAAEAEVVRLLNGEPDVGAVVGDAEDTDGISLVLRMVRRRHEHDAIGRPGTVSTVPAMDLVTLIDGLPSSGLVGLARALVDPLGKPGETSFETLLSWLRHGGRTGDVCADLFIHRNTLAYRMKQIREQVGLDLDNGENRAVLLLAMKIVASHGALFDAGDRPRSADPGETPW